MKVWRLERLASGLLRAFSIWLVRGEPFSISGRLILLALPIALQEMVLAVWLIVKGFNPSAVASSEIAPAAAILEMN